MRKLSRYLAMLLIVLMLATMAVSCKKDDGEDYASLLAALDEMGYEGRITMEAPCTNFEQDAAEALNRLKNAAE